MTGREIYEDYFSCRIKHGMRFLSPFTKERTPSFYIYVKNGVYKHKCFSSGNQGNGISFIMQLYNVNYESALLIVNKNKKKPQPFIYECDNFFSNTIDYDIVTNDYTDNNYLTQQYGISKQAFDMFNVSIVKKYYTSTNKIVFANQNNPIYVYQNIKSLIDDTLGFRLYHPLASKDNKFRGTRKWHHIFKPNEINFKQPIIITGGEKDTLTLCQMGFQSLCFNSETFIPNDGEQQIIYKFLNQFSNIFILYDNDETGIKYAKLLQTKMKSRIIDQTFLGQFKDISDFKDKEYAREHIQYQINT